MAIENSHRYGENYYKIRDLAGGFAGILIRLGFDEIEVREVKDKDGDIMGVEILFPIVNIKNNTETENARLYIDNDLMCNVFELLNDTEEIENERYYFGRRSRNTPIPSYDGDKQAIAADLW